MCVCVCVCVRQCVCVCVLEACAGLARLSCDPSAASVVRQSAVVEGRSLPLSCCAHCRDLLQSPVVDLLKLPRAQFGSLCGFTCVTSIFIFF